MADTPDDNLITGTSSDDILFGTSGTDRILGAEGDDQIHGRGGNDYLVGDGGGAHNAPGNDVMFGGAGDDVMYGDFEELFYPGGHDVMFGGPGNDEMHGGGNGSDVMYGGVGNDLIDSGPDAAGSMYGGQGDDTIQVRGGEFHIFGGAGNDTLDARGMGFGEVHGGAGDDTILGPIQPTGDRILTGDAGDDLIVSRNATDVIQGGSGDDRIEAAGTGGILPEIHGGQGTDTLDLHDHVTMDLTDPAQHAITAMEVLDLTGPAPAPPGIVNTVQLDADVVKSFSGGEDTLRIDGDAGDTVNAVGAWQSAGTATVGMTSYASYSLDGATLLVHPDLIFATV